MVKRMRSFLSAVMLVIAVAVNAQVTTATLSGKVTDTNNEAIIGATVQATHVPSGTHYGTVTNVEGRYTIQGMRAGGPYKVEISYIGYQSEVLSDVQLSLGETFPLNVKMKESSEVLDEVTIVGRAGLNSTKTGAAMSFSSADIANVPSISKSIADATRMNPLVSISQAGAMSFAGANNRYNSFQVDGAVNNDVFGLTSNGQNGGQAGTQPISMETIDQIQVSVSPFDIRQSGFTGGSINAITKSGTNEFHGSVYGDWLNQDLIGSKYTLMNGKDSEKYNDEKNYRYGVTLGGPIIKNKLFFFANYEHANEEYPNAYGLGSNTSKVDAEQAEEIYNILKGMGYEGSLSNPKNYTKSDKAGVKLDWNINDKHKATVGWRMVNAKQLNANSTAAYLNASDYQYDFSSKTNTFTAELQSNFNSRMNNEFLVSYVRVRDERQPYGIFPMIQIKGVGDGTMCLGTERSSTANSLNQDIWSFTDNFTLYSGNHTFTFGAHGEYYKFGNLFIQDAYGTYYFNNVSDFKNFAAGNALAATGKTGTYADGTTFDLYANTLNQYRFGTANTSVTGTPRWTPEFAAGQVGVYAQDKWNVDDRLELTYGLRIDVPLFFDAPTANEPFNEYAAQNNWGVKTNQKLSSSPMFSPRVGFRWKLNDDYNMVLRGGAGIFTGRIPFVWLSNSFSNTGIQMSTYNVYGSTLMNADGEVLKYDSKTDTYSKTGATGNLNGMSLLTGDQSANISTLSASGSQTINVFADDFKFAQNLRFNAALDFTLGTIDFTLEGIYSKNLNDIVYRDLAIDGTGKTVGGTYSSLEFDNRPMFASVTKGTSFSHIYLLDNTSKGYTYNLSLQAVKKFDFGLDLMASYTYTQSKSVNCGTSSVAQSNFNYNYTHENPNNPELGYSAFNIPHQIKASVFYHKDYAKCWNTTVGLIYTGTSGSPYSIYYYGDLNGDGSNGNDLMFIPTDAQLDKMSFKDYYDSKTNKLVYSAADQRENMKAWIAGDSYLSKHRGEYYDRYADNEDFEHHFDFHIAQTYKFKVGRQVNSIELSFNVLNVGNMLNKEWGRYTSLGNAVYYSPVTYSGSGQFQFLHNADYQMRSYSDYYSRWRGQIGLKYTF